MEKALFHLCTNENHSDIFISEYDFRTAINIMALCLSLFNGLELYSFEFMSNHLHMLISGSRDEIDSFFRLYVKTLSKFFRAENNPKDLSDLSYSCHIVETPVHLQNVIVYIHRNASVVDGKISPYTYKWGTGRYYFNPEARARYDANRKKVTLNQRQLFSHSRKFDDVSGLYMVDNYISPLSFCKSEEGERLFTGPGKYLYMLAKNVESSKSIASEIGERIMYNDYELYPVLVKKAVELFGANNLMSLTSGQKLRLAKDLHYDYNSGNKQICRLLKIDISVVNELFPQKTLKSLTKI